MKTFKDVFGYQIPKQITEFAVRTKILIVGLAFSLVFAVPLLTSGQVASVACAGNNGNNFDVVNSSGAWIYNTGDNAILTTTSGQHQTNFCAVQDSRTTQFEQADTDNCATYSGPAAGPGVVDEIACSANDSKASQKWTYTRATGAM